MPGREYPAHPLVGVGAFIHHQGKVVMVKRRFEPNKGRWSLPGGLVEVGERLEEAAKREVGEELGLEVAVEGLMQVADEIIKDAEGRIKYHFILIDYLMRPVGPPTIKLNDESEEYAWFAPSEVDGLDVTENTRLIFKRYLQAASKDNP